MDLGCLTISREEYVVNEDGDVFPEKYVEYASRYSSVGRELERMKLEREELTRMCMNDRKFGLSFWANKGQLLSPWLRFRILLGDWSYAHLEKP